MTIIFHIYLMIEKLTVGALQAKYYHFYRSITTIGTVSCSTSCKTYRFLVADQEVVVELKVVDQEVVVE